MNLAPDFGMRLPHDGAMRELDIHLAPFELDRVSVVNEELFTTTSAMMLAGEPHAIPLDFDSEILEATK